MTCHIFASKVFDFTWILENFEFCEQKSGTFLKSPTFIADNIERTKWSLSIYPRGDELETWISLYLNREEDSKGSATIEVDYEFSFVGTDGSLEKSPIDFHRSFLKNDRNGYKQFVQREYLLKKRSAFLPQGTLTIICKICKRTGKIDTGEQCIARTRIGVERKSFLWKIQNFSSFDLGKEIIFRLKSTSDDKTIMSLQLFLRQNGSSNAIIIKLINSDKSIVFSTFKSSLIDTQDDYVECALHEFWFSPIAQSGECMLSLSKNNLMDKSYLYLPHNTLTLYCELAFSTGVMFQGTQCTVSGCFHSLTLTDKPVPDVKKTDNLVKLGSDMKMDLRSMLQDNILCDVKICAGSETFPAHWFILSARSPVFRAMFQSDMKEKVQDRIVIEDLRPDTVRCMLLFMYTDFLEELEWETASDLYIAAEKYQIMSLKDRCSSFLKSNLSLSNACDILCLSDLLQDTDLKSTVQGFILKNDKIIINSSDWKLLMKDNLLLAAETMLLRFKE